MTYETIATELRGLYWRAYLAVVEGGLLHKIEARISILETAAALLHDKEARA